MQLQILYEDAELIAINKPCNMLSVPGRDSTMQSCTALLSTAYQVLVVHRLDCATSGAMLYAKSKQSQARLQQAFRRRQVSKLYHAVTVGRPDQALIDLPLLTDWPNRPKQKIDWLAGKPAQTLIKPLRELTKIDHNELWLVELRPITGRTHQLRLHLAAIGFPIVGDELYAPERWRGSTPDSHLLLHAREIYFEHPTTRKSIGIVAPACLAAALVSRWREIGERRKIEAKMFEKAQFTWGK